jgi:hypothetical protein
MNVDFVYFFPELMYVMFNTVLMKALSSIMMDTRVFLEHYTKCKMMDTDMYKEYVYTHQEEQYSQYILDNYNIYVKPYIFILNTSKQHDIFFLYFNKYFGDTEIHSITEAKSLYDVLSLIFFIQYYFL